ncbi:phosphatidylserine/phosphatidylglycerophosphate/cardiolipin synthase-like enzyme [Motilibacter rhizosphaerae]|uniref:Phosphatidylserine/phosphatidylglycerophosphate/ cardiolipin synthase-like enzyme n=1 Tax=Motilibacter rhizosphaerae TaxID=598652 RepID=A0A4Q7NSE7_9ACTN|nr:phospholipase D-like domain-containing protein [Motilibacter rhizosphaerae]RZS90021.1 phosphatidylserine/phosphatidylglycerophosphate/cardiolipin synthase-like enzyme [Motilibacter rhizosphaerae]
MGRADDRSVDGWFLTAEERGTPASTVRAWTAGNLVRAHVHGRSYFARLHEVVEAMGRGDELALLAFRVDGDELLLQRPGSAVAETFCRAVRRGVAVRGLVWRSQPHALEQSEEENAAFVRELQQVGGDLLLDARTRRGGSHHQKLVVAQHPREPQRDVAFLGGIDLARSRNDDADHAGDPQPMPFPAVFGERPPWHDVQVEVQGPAVGDLSLTFRERWDGSSPLDLPSPLRMLWDRTWHAGVVTGSALPDPLPDPPEAGPHLVQVLRTYPARWRRYPFAPLGERSIAAAYRKVLARAHRLVYVEDQYLWAPGVARLLAHALRSDPELHLVAVVPRWADKEGRQALPSLIGRERAIDVCRAAGRDRFAIYDVESPEGVPVYVHAKVVVVDDTWAMVGSDNLNRRSWTHDSELSCAVLDETRDEREPRDPSGRGDGARAFARDLRLTLWREHLERAADGSEDDDLLDPRSAFLAARASAEALDAWYAGGRTGPRPAGRLRAHVPERVRRRDRAWAVPVSRLVYDPDGRAWRDRLRHRR